MPVKLPDASHPVVAPNPDTPVSDTLLMPAAFNAQSVYTVFVTLTVPTVLYENAVNTWL